MKDYLPYLVSVLTALISAVVSIAVCKKQTKTEIEKIQEQAKATIEIEREKLQHEKEKMELENKLELGKLQAQQSNDLMNGLIGQVMGLIMQSPELKSEMTKKFTEGLNKPID